jgi:hypothetical protein
VYDPLKGKSVPRVPPLPKKNTIVVFDDRREVVATVDPEKGCGHSSIGPPPGRVAAGRHPSSAATRAARA